MDLNQIRDAIVNFDLTPHIDNRVLTVFALLGMGLAAKQGLRPVRALMKHGLRPRRDLKSRYGGTWAVVTGASDGIGEAICY
jgi:hypothetical protein